MWGSGGSFGAGRQSLCGAASWTYKEMGAGEVEKGEQCKGKEVWAESFRGLGFWKCRGDGVRASLLDPAFRCTQAELLACRSHPQPPRPLFVIWIPAPPCPTLTTPKKKIHSGFFFPNGGVGALLPKSCNLFDVKLSGWHCLQFFQYYWQIQLCSFPQVKITSEGSLAPLLSQHVCVWQASPQKMR